MRMPCPKWQSHQMPILGAFESNLNSFLDAVVEAWRSKTA